MKETLAERNARYLAEGRTVSGGNNPGDKPGAPYQLLQLSGDAAADTTAINNTGLSFVAVVSDNYVLLGTYDE